jgi:hypothetical protein
MNGSSNHLLPSSVHPMSRHHSSVMLYGIWYGWNRFRSSGGKLAVLIRELRKHLDRLLMQKIDVTTRTITLPYPCHTHLCILLFVPIDAIIRYKCAFITRSRGNSSFVNDQWLRCLIIIGSFSFILHSLHHYYSYS